MGTIIPLILIVCGVFLAGWIITLLSAKFPLLAKILMIICAVLLLVFSREFIKEFKTNGQSSSYDPVTPAVIDTLLTAFYIQFAVSDYFLESEYDYTQVNISETSSGFKVSTEDVNRGFIKKTISLLLGIGVVYTILTFIGYDVPLYAGLFFSIGALIFFAIRIIKFLINFSKRS